MIIKRVVLSTLIAVSFLGFSVKADTTVNIGEVYGPSGIANGNFDNYGDTRLDDAYVVRRFNNYGNVISSGAFSVTGDEGIINHPAGNMVVMGYMDFYSANSIFENAGRFSAIDSWYTTYPESFTYLLRGTIKNTGSFLIDKSRPGNACQQAQSWSGPKVIENEGKFEISQGTNCNFSENTSTSSADVIDTHYIQNAGELKVDGYFATDDTRINGGTISGAGTIEGLDYRLLNKVTLSPGSPIGTLSLTSNRPYLFCGKCSIDIELSGPADSDRLQVNSRFFTTGWRINVLLRDGYVPQQGDSFDIINADNGIVIFGNTSSYSNLPELPGGLSWDVQNDGTTITLSVI